MSHPEYLTGCDRDGTLAVDGACPNHLGDNCLVRFEHEGLMFGMRMYGAHFLALESFEERQVTREEYCRAERDAGFHPKPGLGPEATGSFFAHGIHGRHVQTWLGRTPPSPKPRPCLASRDRQDAA